jgi:hypothetical protein
MNGDTLNLIFIEFNVSCYETMCFSKFGIFRPIVPVIVVKKISLLSEKDKAHFGLTYDQIVVPRSRDDVSQSGENKEICRCIFLYLY